jgi:hypothetical protein
LIPSRRHRRPATLVCCAIPLGYGPAAKLAVLAEALECRGMRLMFVGRGIALEFAARHSQLFDDVVPAESPVEVSAALIRSSAGVVSLMDRQFSPLAAEFDRPLFVVDSLLWMRDRLPDAWHRATRLWAQNFIGLHASPGLRWPRVSIVGPIVAPALPQRDASTNRLLVNLGGCESPDGEGRIAALYAHFVVANLLASPLAAAYAQRTALIAGQRCVESLRDRYAGCGIEFRCLAHNDTLAEIGRAALVLTAPGLTMTLECFQRGVPTFFLPPQNYSQWCILRALRGQGLAPAALHWEDLTPSQRLADQLPEAIRNPLVRKSVLQHTADSVAAKDLQRRLAQIAVIDHAGLACRQREFFKSLGADGAETIVNELVFDLKTRERRAALELRH